jgi:2-oxoglutarate ferredoxin oxidoreductase subunit alpha
LKTLLSSFKKVIVPELNLGQLSTILKAKYVRDIISFNKLQGKPFKVAELREEFVKHLSSN